MGTWNENFSLQPLKKLSTKGILAFTFPIAINAPTVFETNVLQFAYRCAQKHFKDVEVFWIDAHALIVASNMTAFSFERMVARDDDTTRLYGTLVTEKSLPSLFDKKAKRMAARQGER
jgi:hypothetical protein